jgi:DNA-binding transcriptional LysR family regulator
LEEDRIDVAVSLNKQSRGEIVSEPVMTMGVTTLWSPQQIPCRGPLSVSDFVAWEHVMVAYRETGHGEIDRQLASQGLARRVRFATQNFSTFPLLLTTLPLFATVPRAGAALAGAVCPARGRPAGGLPGIYPCILRHKRRAQDPALNWLIARIKQAMRGP